MSEAAETSTPVVTQNEVVIKKEIVPTDQEKFTTIVRGVNRYKAGVRDNNLTPEELQTIFI